MDEKALRKAYDAGVRRTLEKHAWIITLPVGVTDMPAALDVPKNVYRTIKGQDKKDPLSPPRWTSGALTISAILSTLFALGFAGMGMRHLGRKLQYIASKRTGVLPKSSPLHQVSREMSIPVYQRAKDYMGALAPSPALELPFKGVGAIAGGIATPFEKLENYLTRTMAKRMRNPMARGKSLEDIGGSALFENPAVNFAMHPLAIAGSIGLDSAVVAAEKLRQRREIEKLQEQAVSAVARPTIQQHILDRTAEMLKPKTQR